MAFRSRPEDLLRAGRADIAKVGPALGAAIERFRRQVEKAEAAQRRRRRILRKPSRLPALHPRQPTPARSAQPHSARRVVAATLLHRRRVQAAGTAQIAAGVEGSANRITAAIRSRLLALRSRLRRGPGHRTR